MALGTGRGWVSSWLRVSWVCVCLQCVFMSPGECVYPGMCLSRGVIQVSVFVPGVCV